MRSITAEVSILWKTHIVSNAERVEAICGHRCLRRVDASEKKKGSQLIPKVSHGTQEVVIHIWPVLEPGLHGI